MALNDIKQMFFKIADISKEKGYIEYLVFSSIDYEDDDLEELLPLSSYYYEAVILCCKKLTSKQKNIINDYKKILLEMWLCCNEENYEIFSNFIEYSSNLIRRIVRTDNEQLLIVLEKDIRNLAEETDFKHWYRKWQNENLKVVEKINNNNICVAIAYPSDANFRDSSNSYFSLSGSAKDYVGTAISNPKWKSKMDIIYDSIGKLIEYIFHNHFIACHLQDRTMRYAYYDNSKHFTRKNCRVDY